MNTVAPPTLYDYWQVLKHYLLFITTVTFLGLGGTTAMVFYVIQPTYEAISSLLILPQNTSPAASMFSQLESQLDSVGPLRSLLGPSRAFSSSVTDLVSILKSRTIAERVVEKVNLKTLPEVEKLLKDSKPQDEKRKIVNYLQQQVLVFPPDSREGTLRIAARFHDKQMPARVANQYIKELEQYIQSLAHVSTLEEQNFVSKQLQQAEIQLQESEEEILRFQKQNKTVSLTDEIKQYIKYLSELETEELSARTAYQEAKTKLAALNRKANELNPAWSEVVSQLEINKSALANRRNEIEKARRKYERMLSVLPIQALTLARLERQVTLKNRMYLLLTQQAQALKMEAARSIAMFKVLDSAITADKPIAPVKRVFIGASAILSLGLGLFLALFHHYWQGLKQAGQTQTTDDML